MRLYRISKMKFAEDLSGEGARLFGGRWNLKGFSVLDTSENISLAAMELLVNLPVADLPDDLRLITIDVPDEISMRVISSDDLPKGWRHYPPPRSLSEMGTEWIRTEESLILRVPSAVIPQEWNVLLNPQHSEMNRVEILSVEPFGFDKRLN